ncbi:MULTISPECIES: recombination regulator RecX [Clostridium]|jgi:regulatory protein|uniref:Regulatory protein RecX n=1 Tax=Clostridium butyricum TaxID=1492 RepID=A0A0A6Q1J4_CLOBU|nr:MULTISPECIES: recombination regulator RecX [Clostridium]ETI91455.1 MAG: Regulatory protein RecX [Clostridium butyricum DORA_1]ALP90091.1 recombinase RecX [Clostridium butyricum]ALS16545.1 recombinase RecX [Clostridium butyricum]ANF13709.1 recombinase RecX [Clostridium butyricum]AOR93776.1 recombination regulator RecX [Clostridium butyricum]
MAIITKIEIQKKNKERVNIYLDEEYAFSISAELVYKENLKVKDVVDIEKLKSVADKESYLRCKNSALKIIERSYKTEKEVIEKLQMKGYEQNHIEASIEFLKEYKFLNDDYYAEAFIKDKLNSKGSQRIKQDLIKKGIPRDKIEEKLEGIDKSAEKNTARVLANKKLRIIQKSENDTYKISGKLYRFLISKGYTYDVVKEVVKDVMSIDEFE